MQWNGVRKTELGTYDVEVIHPWTRERRFVPVEFVSERVVTIRWDMAGLYDIYLSTGNMIARSIKARRKGMCLWKCVDIEALRSMVREYLHPNRQREFEESYAQHQQRIAESGVKR